MSASSGTLWPALSAVLLVLSACFLLQFVAFEWVPSVETPSVVVMGGLASASPEVVEAKLTVPIERAMSELGSVHRIHSLSSGQAMQLRVEVARKGDPETAIAEIYDRLAGLRPSLPDGAVVSLTRQTPESLRSSPAFMTLQLIGPEAADSLKEIERMPFVARLLRTPGVASVEIDGSEPSELRASLNPNLVENHGVSLSGVRNAMVSALRERSFGTYGRSTDGVSGLRVLRRIPAREGESLAALPMGRSLTRQEGAQVRTVLRFDDLGQVDTAPAPQSSLYRIDGQPAVAVVLHRTPGSHLLRVASDVRKAVEEIRTQLPPGVELHIADDRSEDVRRQLRDLVIRGGLGLVLVLLILFFMVRRGRAVGIVVFAVLVSLSAAILLFKPLDLTLNVLTIAGLVLLFGLLVDNAVVVIERLQVEWDRMPERNLESYLTASKRAIRGVWLPLLGGTLSTCAVFVPMVYLSGELRSLFASFAVLSALTLGFSLLTSVILIPRLGQSLQGRAEVATRGPRRFQRFALAPYRLASRYPRLSFLVLLFAIGLPTPLLPDFIEEPSEGWQQEADRDFAARYNRTIGSDRFRELRLWLDPVLGGVTRPFLDEVELGKRWDFPDRPEVNVWLQLPPGSGLERVDERIRPFEEEARKSPAVKRTLVHVAGRVARMTVLFHEDAMDDDEPYLLRERLIAQAVQVAGMEVSVSGLVPMGFYTGLGQVSGFTVHAFGPTYERLEEISAAFARRLERYPRVAEVDINASGYRQPPAQEVIRFHWGADAVARTGLSARGLADVLRPQLWRETPDFYADLDGNPRMPVRIVMEGAEDLDLDTLLHRPLAAGLGGPVRLADHAQLSIKKDPPVIERMNQQYRRTLQVYYRGPHRMGREMLDKELASLALPPGYRMERPRYEFFDAEVRRQFFLLILGTVALVFLVIAAVLESWRLAAVVMLSVPMSWVGIAIGFLLTGQNFAEGAFIGVVLTIGIAVNDAILLADRFRTLREARPATPAALLALLALRQRWRPMWTTTLSSIAGMVPLLIIPDAGNFWVGLAVTVVGGLLASTLLAPSAMLALLSWRAGHSENRGHHGSSSQVDAGAAPYSDVPVRWALSR